MQKLAVDVCVVGGGPAGLSTAHAVLQARPGTRVAVLERSDVRPRGATIGVCPNGLRALEAIHPDLKTALVQHHTEHEQQKRYGPDGVSRPTPIDTLRQRVREHGELVYVAWHKLQSSLATALPEGVLHTHHRFLRFSEGPDGVTAEFETPQGVRSVHAALLVGCDGGQSQVRQDLFGDGPPAFLGMAIWRALRPIPPGWQESYATWGQLGQAVVASTIGGGLMVWQGFAPWPADRLNDIGGGRRAYIQENDGAGAAGSGGAARSQQEVGRERLQRALAAFEGYPQHVLDLIATTNPLAVTEHGQFCREAEQCQAYARGRVALVGDAAHLATPFLGQGCSQAVEDALELGRAIGELGLTPEALAAYERVRLPLASAVQQHSVELCRNFNAGKMDKSEIDVNIEQGFLDRTFAPLAPATPAAAQG